MAAWLSRQRKTDLVTLAEEAGLKDIDDLRKDELASALDDHLRSNASSLSNKPALKEFYERTGSPVKKERAHSASAAAGGAPSDVEKPRKRRVTKVKEEFESPGATTEDGTPGKALIAQTPRAVQRVAARVPLPPSPAVVTDAIDRQGKVIKQKVDTYFKDAGLSERIEAVRESLSSVASIEVIIILLESFALSRKTLPPRYAFTVPKFDGVGFPGFDVSVPDFFQLVTAAFWGPSTLWTGTSLVVPLLFAYFFNLTLGTKKRAAHSVDPLTFNIVKALTTYVVYAKGVRFGGLIGNETVGVVNDGMYGGYQGVLIGAAVGAITSIYDAILKK